MNEFLQETHFCNFKTEDIKELSSIITRGATTDIEKAVAIFNWVRDNIQYRVGLWQMTAEQTLIEKRGTCTNKANLTVALLRLNGIPAGYGILRTKGQDYIGPIVIPILRRRIGFVSTHVYVYAYVGGKWTKCDPSADTVLSISTVKLNPQSRLVVWDGKNDATEDLDATHILSDLGPIANIDSIMEKRSRNGRGVVIKIANLYVQFLRDRAGDANNIAELEENFIDWLVNEKHHWLLYIYFKLVTKYKDNISHVNDLFWTKYMKVYDIMSRASPYQEMIEKVVRILDFREGQVILDAGSGTGIFSIALKNNGARVVALDNSQTAIDIHRAKDSNFEFIISDIRKSLPFPSDFFDGIICSMTLHTISPIDREILVNEFYRTLKPGGKIILVNPSINFNSFKIFSSHLLSSLKFKGLWITIKEVFVFFVPITKMFYYNFVLEFGRSSYKYLELNEQYKYLSNSRFHNISETEEVYANSAVLNWAEK